MDRGQLKELVVEQQGLWDRKGSGVPRDALASLERHLHSPFAVLVTGIRRAGKSTLLRQLMERHYREKAYYFSFEDERLLDFTPADFNVLYECLLELYGERRTFFLDEIQNVPQWENFVRRMQDRGFKFFLTGSNASLLSRELGTKLTGRSISLELFPFSFREYLAFHRYDLPRQLATQERAALKRHFHRYIKTGGMPEFLHYGDRDYLVQLYEDILYRDIVTRYGLKQVRALRELGLFYMSHPGSRFSFNKLKSTLQLGSMNTVRAYTDYFEDSYLFFTLNRFAYSLKKQFIADKKIYCVDNGFIEAIAFQSSRNQGHLLENMAFMELRRQGSDLYSCQTSSGREIDFLVRQGRKVSALIQVCLDLSDPKVCQREFGALQEGMKEFNLKRGVVLVDDDPAVNLKVPPGVQVIPLYRWLLNIA